MNDVSLESYVLERVKNGATKTIIKEEMTSVGWPEDAIDTAYARALVQLGAPTPHEDGVHQYTKRASTADIVISIFSFVLLGTILYALITLYFAVISTYYPDALTDLYDYNRLPKTIHYAIAALVISAPLYVLTMRLWLKKFSEDEVRIESRLTKWITYLVLLAALIGLVGDLIGVIYMFLQEDMTMRFFLKSATVFTVAGMVFGFYYFERKKVQYRQNVPRTIFMRYMYVFIGVVVLGVALGFTASGTPSIARERALDERRTNDLYNLATCITRYAREYEELPHSIADLQEDTAYYYCGKYQNDPKTGSPYEYRVIQLISPAGNNKKVGTFELCANFALDTEHLKRPTQQNGQYYVSPLTGKWGVHPKGRACDTESVVIRPNSESSPAS